MVNNYINAWYDRKKDIIRVIERDTENNRIITDYDVDYSFYVSDPNGRYKSIYGNNLKRIQPKNKKQFYEELKKYDENDIFESDLNKVFKTLSNNYLNLPLPTLNIAYFDIETDFDKITGYSPSTEATLPITSIAIHLEWIDELICLAVPPKTLTFNEAKELIKDIPNVILYKSEKEMLDVFLDLIEDADILSAYNGNDFDIPYIVNRVSKTLSIEDTKRFCLFNEFPVKREYNKFGKESYTYELVGRCHIDYLELYKKYNSEERHSYSLDSIAEYELNENKLAYNGTLDELYNNDFRTFIEYNIQDTRLLDRIDKKRKYFALANGYAHQNGVLIENTLRAVATIDQAIVNEAHLNGKIVKNRKRDDIDEEDENSVQNKAAGAYVSEPRIKGFLKWVANGDANSLYPSTIRNLNMAPETIIGQVRLTYTNQYLINKMKSSKKIKFAQAWNGLFGTFEYEWILEQNDKEIIIDWENGTSDTLLACQAYELIFNSNWVISANGTIFTTEFVGIIPGLLTKWYSNRKIYQKEMKVAIDINYGIQYDKLHNIKLKEYKEIDIKPTELMEYIKNDENKVKEFIECGLLSITNNVISYNNKDYSKNLIEYYSRVEQTLKLSLNSTYGALLNEGSRFYDQRLGQSTTLSGRQIVKHMGAEVNRIITGIYQYDGEATQYSDTDSIYFSAYSTLKSKIDDGLIAWDKESVTKYYDEVIDLLNESFPSFMKNAFNCLTSVIKAGRENVAITALFIKKKRYALMVYDKEGKRKDINGNVGEIKAMGLDSKRSDTPKYMQKFLLEILEDVLLEVDKSIIFDKIKQFRLDFTEKPGYEKGSPKRANNITKYERMLDTMGKKSARIPGHVLSSINYNTLRKINNDVISIPILDGFKVIVCKLKGNIYDMSSIAYPVDEPHLPQWIKELPFDDNSMEDVIIDKKLHNLIGVLNWDISLTKVRTTFDSFFDWGE